MSAEALVYERFEKASGGTVRGGVRFEEEVVGWGGLGVPNRYAAAFDGQPETSIVLGSERKIKSTDFTVEAFVRLSGLPRYQAIAGDWDEQGNQRAWALVVTPGGGLRLDVSPDGAFHVGNKLESPTRLLRAGPWYHVAGVSEGNTSRLYVNGREVAAGKRSMPGILSTGKGRMQIGNLDCYATEGPRPLQGSLDEVRITEKALVPAAFIRTREEMPAVALSSVPERYEMPFEATDAERATAWQTRARARLMELVAKHEPRTSLDEVPLDVQLGAAADKGSYTLRKISLRGNSTAGERYEGLLAIPKGDGPFPAMLALHGHGGSAEDVFDAKSLYHGMADRFARGGYVVFAPSFPHRDYAALMLWDLLRAVEILRGRPEVDAERVGVAGLSMGGEWTMWIAACDPRLKVAVVSGWLCTTKGVFSVYNCPCWELPGLVELMDICEVHLMIAPRPVLFESAERDGCFPIEHTREAFRRVRSGYKVFGAEESVQQDTWPAGHEWHGEKAYGFVDKVLGGHAGKQP